MEEGELVCALLAGGCSLALFPFESVCRSGGSVVMAAAPSSLLDTPPQVTWALLSVDSLFSLKPQLVLVLAMAGDFQFHAGHPGFGW